MTHVWVDWDKSPPLCLRTFGNKRLFWQWKRTITYSRKTMFQYIITEKYIYIIMEWSLYRKQLYSKLSDRLGSIIWNYKIFSNSKQVAESTMYDFHNSTHTLKFWTEKRAFNRAFFVFHLILMKLGEIVVHMGNYNFTKFHQNQMKNKKFY